MNPFRSLLFPALVLASIFALVTARGGLSSPTVETVKSPEGVRLEVEGNLIAIFRVPNGTSSPERRAEVAADRLRELINHGLRAEEISVRESGKSWAVYARGGLLMIATAEEAAERK